jgi:putative spermidine/putrescine transport system ATP-binding protein
MMLAGFESPTEGEILLEGRSITRLPPHKRDIGMVFQNYALFPHMTVWQNVAFPLSIRSTPSAEVAQRVAQALAVVKLTGFEQRRAPPSSPADSSSGWPSRARSYSIRAWCCSTSPWARWTSSSASRCSTS